MYVYNTQTLYYTREMWKRKAKQIIETNATSIIKNNNDFSSYPNLVTECKYIYINDIKINASAFTIASHNIKFGEITKKDIIDAETNKKIGENYLIEEPIAEMEYGTIKELRFAQEIGTSGKNQSIRIYIKDDYSTLKKMLVELD